MSISNTLAIEVLTALKGELDGGFLYIFAGTVPADADDALNMSTTHTQLAKLSVNGDGVTGLTFATPTGTTMTKTGSETWEGLVNFDGVGDASPTLTPTFFRFCTSGDNGRGVATAPRLQGSCGGPTSGANMTLGSDTLTDNGTNEVGVSMFLVPVTAA